MALQSSPYSGGDRLTDDVGDPTASADEPNIQ